MNNSKEKQELLLSYLLTDPKALSVCRHIMKPEYFAMELQSAVAFIIEHSEQYRSAPNHSMVAAETNVGLPQVDDAGKPDRLRWVLDEIETHCRSQATIIAVMDAAEKIHKGEMNDIVGPIKEAVLLSLHRDLGIRYFDDPAARLRAMLENDAYPTGYKHLDSALGGGVYRGGLQLVLAPSGVGKSMYLANQTVNYLLMGKSVVYITLGDLPANWVAKRIDSMLTGVPSQRIFEKIDEVAALVVRMSKPFGGPCPDLYVKKMPFGSTPSNVRAFIKSLELSVGFVPDALVIDYLDVMMPDQKVNVENISLRDRFCAEGVKQIAEDEGMFCWSASQMGRGAIGEEDQNQDMIAGGKTKINTCDNAFGIYQPLEMREQGLVQLQLVKTRTSGGLGRKIMLNYDKDTARYSDAPDELNDRKPKPIKSNASAKMSASPATVEQTQPQTTASGIADSFDRLKRFREKLK